MTSVNSILLNRISSGEITRVSIAPGKPPVVPPIKAIPPAIALTQVPIIKINNFNGNSKIPATPSIIVPAILKAASRNCFSSSTVGPAACDTDIMQLDIIMIAEITSTNFINIFFI